MGIFSEEPRRTLGIRDRQIIWERAGRKCQNCSKEISFTEMQLGHKTAYARGGSTSFRNSLCLCYGCNKLQGTDSWSQFQRKQGREDTDTAIKNKLKLLSISQLRFLANKHNIKVKSRVVEDWLSSHIAPPNKKQYINALSKVASETF